MDVDTLLISALVEGLHAQVFAVHSGGDPEASHRALGDGGQIHETVHALVRAMPSRAYESATVTPKTHLEVKAMQMSHDEDVCAAGYILGAELHGRGKPDQGIIQAALDAWKALPEDERNGERPWIMGFNAGWDEALSQLAPLAPRVMGEGEIEAAINALADLLSWFPEERTGEYYNVLAGRNGADDALEFASATLGRLKTLSRVPVAPWPGKAWADVVAERQRQIEKEGYTPEHDDEHDSDNALARAASCYALAGLGGNGPFWITHLQTPQQVWPYRWEWKPADRRRNLVKAAALLLAEIERMDRARILPAGEQGQ